VNVYLTSAQQDILLQSILSINQVKLRIERDITRNEYIIQEKRLQFLTLQLSLFAKGQTVLQAFQTAISDNSATAVANGLTIIQLLTKLNELMFEIG
jgi:hypothetical protein